MNANTDDGATPDASCAQKACASDCPLEGAVRVEVGSEFHRGLFYCNTTANVHQIECSRIDRLTGATQVAFAQIQFRAGDHYATVNPTLGTFRVTAIRENINVWHAKLGAPVPAAPAPTVPRVGDILRTGQLLVYVGNWTPYCVIVLRRLDTGAESTVSFSVNSIDTHVIQADAEVVFCEISGFLLHIPSVQPN